MKKMALAIFIPNLAEIYQPILELYQTADHPALSPGFCHLEWRVKTADNYGGSGITTWKTRRKYSPFESAGRGGTLGVRFGLAHFLSRSYYFALFSEVT